MDVRVPRFSYGTVKQYKAGRDSHLIPDAAGKLGDLGRRQAP